MRMTQKERNSSRSVWVASCHTRIEDCDETTGSERPERRRILEMSRTGGRQGRKKGDGGTGRAARDGRNHGIKQAELSHPFF